MNGFKTTGLRKIGLGAVLAATVMTTAAPAEAQRWRRYDRGRGGDVAAGAILGGIVGLGVGAAIAGGNRDRRYYDDGYYYGPRPRARGYYYAPPPPPPVYYRGGRGYYDRGYYDRGYYGRPYRGYYGY